MASAPESSTASSPPETESPETESPETESPNTSTSEDGQPAERTDPSYDLYAAYRQPLDAIFHPKTVAVVGASDREGSVGRSLLWNLISNPFGGTVFPVNPRRDSVLGIQAYPRVQEVPRDVELALIATPAHTVPDVMRDCVEADVDAAIIISAGFKETGEEGVALEKEILEIAREGQIRVVGPNCLGVMRPHGGLNASFAQAMAQPGNVAFISQSGALLTAILDWSFRENVGFSAFVSVGSMLDVGWGDLISYLGDDPKTDSIVLYMESIGDARAFVSAARDVARQKPIIVIKAGRTEAAAEAAASHTGSLAGSDAVLRAAFRRTGVLRVDEINDLFNMAEVLAKQPRPRGPRLTILTNAGGPGVLATDALIDGGGELADLSDETMEALNGFLPEAWSHGNPIDILGDAGPDRYEKAIAQAVKDEASDGLLVVLTPQAMSDPIDTAQILTPYAGTYRKPILASWMGGSAIARSERLLNDAGLPTFPYPDTAARVFNNMWRYSYNLRGLYETPSLPEDKEGVPDRIAAGRLIGDAHEAGRTILTEHESKQVLAAYGIPVVTSYVKETADEAVAQANAIGYPVVLKLHSTTITHKTDVGGVQLNLEDEAAVRDAFARIRSGVSEEGFDGVNVQPMLDLDSGYELIVGSSIDAQFGPVLLFGAGGTLVEVFEDRALGLPPLNTTLARRMMEQTKIYKALRGVRGRQAVDLDALEDLMVRFSQLVVEQPRIKEIDINPLFARPKAKASDDGSAGAPGEEQGLVALDARVVLHPFDVGNDALPQSAIRPYPRQYCDTWTMKGGEDVLIRPIRPEDEPLLVDFHDHISERSVYMRYASLMKQSQRIAHERLSRMCFIDYDREMALVVEHPDEESGEPEIVAVGRLTKQFGTEEAEFAMLVLDAYQREGLGTELLRRLVEIGRDEGLSHITADILRQNRAMQRVCEKLGFEIIYGDVRDEMVKAVKAI